MNLSDFLDAVRKTSYRWEVDTDTFGWLHAHTEEGQNMGVITAVCLHVHGSAPSGDDWPNYWHLDAQKLGLPEKLRKEIANASGNFGPFRPKVRRMLLEAAGISSPTPESQWSASAIFQAICRFIGSIPEPNIR